MNFEIPLLYVLVVLASAAFAGVLTVQSVVRRKGAGRYLCEDCRFNNPESCLKAERPYATRCTAYRVVESGVKADK